MALRACLWLLQRHSFLCVYAPGKRGLHAVAARVFAIVGLARGVPAAPFTKRNEVC